MRSMVEGAYQRAHRLRKRPLHHFVVPLPRFAREERI